VPCDAGGWGHGAVMATQSKTKNDGAKKTRARSRTATTSKRKGEVSVRRATEDESKASQREPAEEKEPIGREFDDYREDE